MESVHPSIIVFLTVKSQDYDHLHVIMNLGSRLAGYVIINIVNWILVEILHQPVLSVTYNHIIKSDGIVYHNNGGQDDWGTAIDEYNARINTSIALELAKYVLVELVDGQIVESLVEEFDNDTRFINGIVEFLIDMGWIEYNYTRGLYQMTAIGEINVSALKVIIWI
jgi:hypothetical protein